MNNCTVCDDRFRNDKPNKIICDGVCRQVFHAECANFNKDALMYYREMPNLQWLCDSCINQAHSFNVSSPLFNKFNSTVVVPISSPSYVQRSFPAANRNRKPKAKPRKSSVFLVTKSPNVNRSPNAKLVTRKADDSMKPPVNETQPENRIVKSPGGYGSNQLITSPFNKFNSTVISPTSSPSYVQRSLIGTKRNRNPFPNAKPKNTSVYLVTRSPNVERDIRNDNDSMSSSPSVKEMQPENRLVKSPGANGSNRSNPVNTSATTQSDVAQSDVDQLKPQHISADLKESLKEPLELKAQPDNSSSFAEVLAESSIAEPGSVLAKNSTIQSQNGSIQSQRIASPSSETYKVAYVSNFDPSVTEEQIVNYLIRKNIIVSAEDVSCKKLVSPGVNLDHVSFVSFKITVKSKMYQSVVEGKFWPEGVIAREFVNR